jgi:hypothetical protein
MKNLTTQLRSASPLSLDFVGVVPKKKSPMDLRIGWLAVGLLSLVLFLAPLTVGQTPAQTASALPHLVRFAGTVKDLGGSPLTGMVGITFALYSEQAGGTPLWLETQNVTADSTGHYTVLLGSTRSEGLPEQLFTSEQAHWVGVQISGQPEQARVLLVSAPYALKAGDAETIGGLPPSAFMMAAPGGERGVGLGSSSSSSQNPGANIGGSGTLNFIPIWIDSSGDLGNSILFQSGGNEVGIGTTTPAATLDVNGGVISRGSLQLPSTGTATSGSGFNSQPFLLQGSSFNSGTQKAIGPVFQWQTEPSGNNTSSPAGTLNLLYGSGSGSPAETGLNIASSGKITFATGQTFPGTGTITGITAGSGLSGGGTSGNVTLSINVANANKTYAQLAAANTFTKNQTVNGTVTATSFSGNGTGVTNVNASQLGGLSSSAFAQLGAASNTFSGAVTAASFSGSGSGLTNVTAANALNLGGLPPSAYQPAGSYATTGSNTFTGNQNITGNVAATGSVSGAAATFTGLVTEAGALLPATGTATASQGFNSQPFDSVTSVFNSTGGTAQNQDFRWLAEPVGNDTSSPSGKLDLLFGANGATPAETGLSVASNGQITFATGQTFPGGSGTVTSVGSGLGLTGGPITTSGTLSIDPTVIPQLGAANTFTGNQGVNGTVTASSSGNTISGTTTGTNADSAVSGNATATSGTTFGVFAQSASPSGFGLYATNAATTGTGVGVFGTTQSPTGFGVYGTNAVGGTGVFGEGAPGVYGLSSPSSSTGYGVVGVQGAAPPPPGNPAGVYGTSSSSNGYGVEGQSSNIGVYGTGSVGVDGVTSAAAGAGVSGYANATTGFANGVIGVNYSASGGIAGVTGVAYASTGTTAGVLGNSNSSAGYGVEGIASVGGSAGYFLVTNSNANIIQGSNNGTSKFTVDSAGDVTAAGAVSGSSFQIGGQLFAYGSSMNASTLLGFGGPNSNISEDTAIGYGALEFDTGGFNTAVGAGALLNNTTGEGNTGIGLQAGSTNDTSNLVGNYDTALGPFAEFSTGTLSNATAIGAYAVVSESNALVLGNKANVGIGTSAPGHLLDVAGAVAFDSLGQNNGTNFIDITLGLNAGEGMSSSRTAAPNQYGIDLYTDFTRRISIEQHGNVGIGTTSPDSLLSVNGSADKPGGGSWGTFSDARLKTVNGGFTDGLSQVMKIQPIHYRYKPDNAMGIRDTDEHIGVVAQEVQKVIPEAVTENSKGYLLVNNDPIIWTMLNAIKEQQREIKQQQNLLRAQSAAMRSLKAEVRETRESLRKVKAQVAASQPALVATK